MDGAQQDAQAHNDARLVKMANQIATFFSGQPQIEAWRGVAAHINDFWAAPMRARLLEMIGAGGAGLRPEVTAAAPAIRRPGAPPVEVAGVDPGTPPARQGGDDVHADPAFGQAGEGGADG